MDEDNSYLTGTIDQITPEKVEDSYKKIVFSMEDSSYVAKEDI